MKQHVKMNKVKFISILSFAIAPTLLFTSVPVYSLTWQFATWGSAVSLLLLIPWWINVQGKAPADRIVLSGVVPVSILVVSIATKSFILSQDLVIDPNSFYLPRIVLIASTAIPLVTIRLASLRPLIIGLAFPCLCLLLFDPLHYWFGVGFETTGSAAGYYIASNLLSVLSLAAIITSMLYLKKQIEHMEYKHTRKIGNLEVYLTDLISLSNSPAVLNGDTEGTYREVAERIRNSLKVSRVSVWEFNESRSEIRCRLMWEKDGYNDRSMITLARKDHRQYFEAIEKHKLLIAPNAWGHGATQSFLQSYLKPLKILSMMDIVFMNEGKPAGIICCEHQNEQKKWFVEDSLFLSAMGDTVSYMHSNRKRILRNEELEKHVKLRTNELEKKNEQLSEYAYINSHIMRAPVARIMGIHQLLHIASGKTIDPEIMKHFRLSVEELDDITKKIQSAIEEYGPFDRQKITRKINE